MRRTVLLGLVLLAIVGTLTVVHGQSSQTFTVSWTHDGANTTTYNLVVDGTPAAANATCTGTGPTRLCTSATIVLTLNMTHTIVVQAVGPLGSASSDPFTAGPPTKPGSVVVVVKLP